MRATDRQRRTRLSPILRDTRPGRTGTLVHYGSQTEPSSMRLCSMLVCFDYFCRDFRFRLCGRISWSVSSRLSHTSPPPSPPPTKASRVPSIQTSESRRWRTLCPLRYRHCYSAILLYFLTRSIELNPLSCCGFLRRFVCGVGVWI